MPIRVLHLRDSPWVDGPGRTILETGTHVDPARVDYHIGAFVSESSAVHPLVAGARARGVEAHHILDEGGLSKSTLQQILELVERHRIDIIHTSDFRSNLFGWYARRHGCRVKLVSTAHGWIANTRKRQLVRFVDKLMLNRFDAIVVVSNATRALIPRWWIPDRRVTVLHNALVLGQYGSEVVNAPRRRVDPSARVVIANVGRLSPEKGQALLLHSFARLACEYPNLELCFAGTGTLEDSLRGLSRTLGIESKVRFLGFVNDMPAMYRDVDLVVQSSFTEGLPNVILEAAYLRVPVVATAVGGTAEVISHGRSGYLIRPHAEEQLVKGMRAFLRDPTTFTTMAEAAHEDVVREFAFDVRTERLMQLYERVAAR